MNRILFALLFIPGFAFAQGDYSPLASEDGLDISSKIDKVKNEEGEYQSAVLLQVINQNNFDVDYTFSLDLYWQGKTVESSGDLNYCIRANKKIKGKLNGIYFTSSELTNDQMASEDFTYEMLNLTVNQIEQCPKN